MFQQVVAEIEVGSVFFDMTISNTPKAALRRLEANITLREARENLVIDPEDVCLYLENARKAFSSRVPEGYVNPDDGALAAYVFLLARVPQTSAQRLVDEVAASGRADLRKSVWVARYYAERIPSLTMQQATAQVVGEPDFTPPCAVGRPCSPNTVFSFRDAGLNKDLTIRREGESWQRLDEHCRTLICV